MDGLHFVQLILHCGAPRRMTVTGAHQHAPQWRALFQHHRHTQPIAEVADGQDQAGFVQFGFDLAAQAADEDDYNYFSPLTGATCSMVFSGIVSIGDKRSCSVSPLVAINGDTRLLLVLSGAPAAIGWTLTGYARGELTFEAGAPLDDH